MNYRNSFSKLILILLFSFIHESGMSQQKQSNEYNALVSLFKEWRAFENPPLLKGAPDYTAVSFNKRWPAFKILQSRLNRIDTSSLSVEQTVDRMLVWPEMTGYDFNYRV